MNQGRFDDLTRSLATSKISRARALKMVAAAAVGATLSSWGASMRSEEAAAKNTKNTKCNKDKQCPAGQFCVSGVCVDCRGDFDCPNPTPRFCLAGACVQCKSDSNCGACQKCGVGTKTCISTCEGGCSQCLRGPGGSGACIPATFKCPGSPCGGCMDHKETVDGVVVQHLECTGGPHPGEPCGPDDCCLVDLLCEYCHVDPVSGERECVDCPVWPEKPLPPDCMTCDVNRVGPLCHKVECPTHLVLDPTKQTCDCLCPSQVPSGQAAFAATASVAATSEPCNDQCCGVCEECVNNECVTKQCPGSCLTCDQTTGECRSCDPNPPRCETCPDGTCVTKTCEPSLVLDPKTCKCSRSCPEDEGLFPCGQFCCYPCQTCQDGTCVFRDDCDPCFQRSCATGQCEPRDCGPCEPCNPQTGLCEWKCGDFACETCENGACVPIPDVQPCGETCCSSCQVCEGGTCRGCKPACETCENGACVPIPGAQPCGDTCCGADEFCEEERCIPTWAICPATLPCYVPDLVLSICSGGGPGSLGCVCNVPEGQGGSCYCIEAMYCDEIPDCTTHADCPQGWACVTSPTTEGCGHGGGCSCGDIGRPRVCVPLCGVSVEPGVAETNASRTAVTSAPTDFRPTVFPRRPSTTAEDNQHTTPQ